MELCQTIAKVDGLGMCGSKALPAAGNLGGVLEEGMELGTHFFTRH